MDDDVLCIQGAESISDLEELEGNQCHKLSITGLRQESFEFLVDNYGYQFDEIEFFKCPLVTDFQKLEQLRYIERISFFWNQRVTRLWDLSKNDSLKYLSIDDFTRLKDFNDLPRSKTIEEFNFGNKVWSTFVLDTLAPIAELESLKRLAFSAKKIVDGDISPLAEISNLKELHFPTNLFTTEQVAWLKAKIGDKVKSKVLAPLVEHSKYVYIIGKRKPSFDIGTNKQRVEKYQTKFIELVEYYKSNPCVEAPNPQTKSKVP